MKKIFVILSIFTLFALSSCFGGEKTEIPASSGSIDFGTGVNVDDNNNSNTGVTDVNSDTGIIEINSNTGITEIDSNTGSIEISKLPETENNTGTSENISGEDEEIQDLQNEIINDIDNIINDLDEENN